MELERYRELAYGTALALLGDHHRAEDAVQDAFVEAHTSWESLRDPKKRAAWIRGIVRHRCFRILRRRDMGSLPETAGGEEPWQEAARKEERGDVLSRVRALPQPLREVVVLHYLRCCPQKEVARFLDVPATTVNNRLHLARRLLRGGTMQFDTPEVGTVIAVDAPLVDVRFEPDAVPDIFDALSAAESAPNLRVAQIDEGGVVRCLAIDDAIPDVGRNVVNRTALGGTYLAPVASDARLKEVVDALRTPCEGMRETGIKPVDLFCPVPASGSVGLFGTARTGKMVLTQEIARRLSAPRPRLFYLGDRSEPAVIRDIRMEDEEFDSDVVWLLSERATDPEFAETNEIFDTSIYCSPLLGMRFLWPAVDPLRSRSNVVVDERHARVAQAARKLLAQAREESFDPVWFEYLACRAYAAAKRRLDAAPDPDSVVVARARRLEAFLTTPFDVGREMTGVGGEVVPLAATLDGVEAILNGDLDNRAPKELSYIGSLNRS
ncbi:MAG: sigma-70 family RNA polymerase sigma factor [Planctomycetota bacterium]|jgi:F-type H+-transporting ATPase subunit beta